MPALTVDAAHWPYPRWIAHRGAGKLAPENTLAAFRLGAQYGYRMFECDAKLSADGVVFLLHDATLTRTTNAAQRWGTNASTVAGQHPWGELAQLDAGGWHSRAYAGEPLPTLENIARFCQDNAYCLNIEIKPTPGLEAETAEQVAAQAARLWRDAAVPPLLTSFSGDALQAAARSAPQLPRGLLLDSLRADWQECARTLDCVAVVCHHSLYSAEVICTAHDNGLLCLSYTVNEVDTAQTLWGIGVDGLITDAVDKFSPER